ncbi:hypothetical protein J500_1296 [Acinetobacter sp. 479375]|nr:hypothetical protein J500_1296 [Acinetobacter sp. 479375]
MIPSLSFYAYLKEKADSLSALTLQISSNYFQAKLIQPQ